jgi:hypothetical protein
MTDDPRRVEPSAGDVSPARQTVNDMISAGLLDDLMGRVDAEGLALTGDGGLLPELVKAVLERGLTAKLTGHLGYEKGDPAGRGSPNSRNGHSPKTVSTEVGDVGLAVPRGPGLERRPSAQRATSRKRSSSRSVSGPQGWKTISVIPCDLILSSLSRTCARVPVSVTSRSVTLPPADHAAWSASLRPTQCWSWTAR